MKTDLIVKIKSAYLASTKSEKKVAEFVLENMDKMSYISITDLAKACSVGEATVLRFCKKIGYSGFHSFKKEVIDMMEEKEIEENDINKTYEDMTVMLNHTLKLQKMKEIKIIANLIKNAENIYFYGVGLSALSAKAAEVRLSLLGYRSFYFESQTQVLRANSISEKDLVIGLSISGESIGTIKSLKIAKRNGATIVGMTNYNPSSLANLSDYVLLTASKEISEAETTLVAVTSQIFIIEEICDELIKIDEERIMEAKRQISKGFHN